MAPIPDQGSGLSSAPLCLLLSSQPWQQPVPSQYSRAWADQPTGEKAEGTQQPVCNQWEMFFTSLTYKFPGWLVYLTKVIIHRFRGCRDTLSFCFSMKPPQLCSGSLVGAKHHCTLHTWGYNWAVLSRGEPLGVFSGLPFGSVACRDFHFLCSWIPFKLCLLILLNPFSEC